MNLSHTSINNIDLQKGAERFGGNVVSYLQVLRSYTAQAPSFLNAIKNPSQDNLADYVIAVHGMKGASRGICAKEIGDMAEALEKAAKEGDLNFVSANTAALVEAVTHLNADLADFLDTMTDKSPRPPKDRPDKETLNRLFLACEAYDMDGVDTAMAEIESWEYHSDNGLAVWLRENVDLVNFAEIKEKLSRL